MNYIDRNNFAAAKLQGLVKDLHLVGNEYELGLSILFVGYVLMQVPSNLLLNFSGRPSWYIGFFVIAWGLVSLLTSQVKNAGDIIACRFILGLVEAPFFAGVLFYLSKWYTKGELNLRMSIFYSGSLLSGAFGNLIAAGILHGLAGKNGLSAWQWLYIIEGTITIAIGIVIVFVLPDFPHTWKLLSPEMKHVANRRMAVDAADSDIDEAGGMSQIRGMKLAFTDPKTYVLAIMYHGTTGAAGFQNFFPTLTKTLGYNSTISLILVAPPYIFMVLWSLGHSMASDKIGNRFWFFIYPIPLTIIGALIFVRNPPLPFSPKTPPHTPKLTLHLHPPRCTSTTSAAATSPSSSSSSSSPPTAQSTPGSPTPSRARRPNAPRPSPSSTASATPPPSGRPLPTTTLRRPTTSSPCGSISRWW